MKTYKTCSQTGMLNGSKTARGGEVEERGEGEGKTEREKCRLARGGEEEERGKCKTEG